MEEVWFRKHLECSAPSPTGYRAAALAQAKCSSPGFFTWDFERFHENTFPSVGLRQNEPTFICRAQQEQVESLRPTAALIHPSPGGGGGAKS